MSTYRLDKLFAPRSVAVVGASPRDTSPGRAVLSNLRAAAFEGSIDLVNPRYAEIEGIKAVKTIQDLPTPPDLVVIATPPQSVPGIVKAAGEKGAAAAIIITAGLPICPPSQSVCLQRVAYEGRSKLRGTARFRGYDSVSVCEIRPGKRHFGPLSPRAIFGVSFYVCATVRSPCSMIRPAIPV